MVIVVPASQVFDPLTGNIVKLVTALVLLHKPTVSCVMPDPFKSQAFLESIVLFVDVFE